MTWISGPMELPSSDHTALAPFRLVVEREGRRKEGTLHLGVRGTKWKPSTVCTGGMGGEPDGGYRSACDTAWCLPVWNERQRQGRTMCAACQDIVGANNVAR